MDFVPSPNFQQAANALAKQKYEGEITDQEYNTVLDEMIQQEMKSRESTILDIQRQNLRKIGYQTAQTYEAVQRKKEADAQMQARIKEQRDNQHKENEKAAQQKFMHHYRYTVIPYEIAVFQTQYASTKWWYKVWQIVSIVASIAATSLIGLDVVPRLITVFFSAGAAMATAFLSTFRLRERNYNYYQAISRMETECQQYDQGIGPYAQAEDEKEAFQLLMGNISDIRQEYASQELALWKSEKTTRKDKASDEHKIQNKEVNDASDEEEGLEEQEEKTRHEEKNQADE